MNKKTMIIVMAAALLANATVSSIAKADGPQLPGYPTYPGMPVPMPVPGPISPGPVTPVQDAVYNNPLMQWCQNAVYVLAQARAQAAYAMNYGDYDRASLILINGLAQANASSQFAKAGRPLTSTSISRGIQMAQALSQAVQGELNGQKTLVYFLFRYYEFIESVSATLDIPFHIPYIAQIGHAVPGFDMWGYESRFVQFAKEQVENVLDTMAVDDGYQVYPVGSTKAFLKALEFVTAFAAADLTGSLWNTRYACAVMGLRQLSQRLGTVVYGGYYNEPEAMNATYREARMILSSIVVGTGCEGYQTQLPPVFGGGHHHGPRR